MTQYVHWATALLVLAAFIFGPGGSEQKVYSAAREFERRLHETLGFCVFLLAIFRMGWRAIDTRPDPPEVPAWMAVAAKTAQYGLLVLLFALPVTAVVGAWLEGHPVTLLGGVDIGLALSESHAVGAWIAELHTWLGNAILWLAGFHAAAALFHHFVLKDGVLVSMVPRWLLPRG